MKKNFSTSVRHGKQDLYVANLQIVLGPLYTRVESSVGFCFFYYR